MQFIFDDQLRLIEGGTDPITAAIEAGKKTIYNPETPKSGL